MATQGFAGHLTRRTPRLAPRPHAVLYAPKINGQEVGRLGYIDNITYYYD